MNYLPNIASREHLLPQYFAYGFPFGMSFPHQMQQEYKGLINFFIVRKSRGLLNKLYPLQLLSLTRPKQELPRFPYFHYLMTKLTNNWRFQHLFNRPTAPNAVFKNSTLKALLSRPLSHWLRNALIGNKMIVRAIKILIPKSVPLTIRRTISLIRIYAVYCGILFAKLTTMFEIRVVHIAHKLFKRTPKTLDTSPTVVLIPIMLRVVAPLLNGRPNLIEPSSRHSVFHSLSLANGGMIVNQFYTPMWTTKSQLTDFYNKVMKK